MKRLLALVVVITCVGCTSLQPIAGAPADLRQRINSGEVLKAGDSVLIETTDLKTHQFVITGFAPGVIEGKKTSIPVDDIIVLEKREYDGAKTWASVAATVLVIGGFAVLIAAHTVPAYAL
jgi:hypothetical protein